MMKSSLAFQLSKQTLICLLVIATCLAQTGPVAAAPAGAQQAQGEAPLDWTYVAPGVDYQKFHINNGQPVDIFVTRMDRANPNVTIDTALGQGRLSGGTETVLGMTARYNQTINYWGSTWGNRSSVVAAVNGYFFGDPNEPVGVPWSGVVNSGWYAKRFTEPNIASDAGFAWMMDRTAHIGTCVTHNSNKNYLYFVDSPSSYSPNVRAINVAHNDEALILYTPQYDADSRTDVAGDVPTVEILVEMTRPSVILSNPDSAPLGYIRQIRHNQGSTPIPFDHVVISAWGTVGDTMWGKAESGDINIGDPMRIVQQISNCSGSLPDWTKTYAALGGDYHFLTAGVVRSSFSNPDAAVRNARTAVGFNNDYVFFVVVDSHNPGVSMGLNIGDLGNWMNNTLGATDAVSLDSGTSSTMVVNGSVINNTNCTYTRNCGTQQVDESTPAGEDAIPVETEQPAEPAGWNAVDAMASVGTALLMVVVEPVQRSAAFTPTQVITTTAATEIRLGPGTNYASLGTIPAGTNGEVLAHLSGMNGVLAKGSFWWKVDLGDLAGWVKQDALVGGAMDRPYQLFLPSISRQAAGQGPLPVYLDFPADGQDGERLFIPPEIAR